jgi:CXXX repeat peptide maturase
MPDHILRSAIDLAQRESLKLRFLYGDKRPPRLVERLTEQVEHTKILPLKLRCSYLQGVFIIQKGDFEQIDRTRAGPPEKVILRVRKNDLGDLSALVESLAGSKRIDVVLQALGSYGKADFEAYAVQLDKIKNRLAGRFSSGTPCELNIITDRLRLSSMRNCNAGMEHRTVAPDGRVYLCPGFFHGFPKSAIGDLSGQAFWPDTELLPLEKAPICSGCDAFHCRRCFYLNVTLTGEINTPSRQQCVVSHLEQLCSFFFREEILPFVDKDRLALFSEPQSLDPLEFACVNQNTALEQYRRHFHDRKTKKTIGKTRRNDHAAGT